MQFVHLEAFENHHFLMSVNEVYIHHHLGIDCKIEESKLEDLDLDENNLTICYGKFLCQPEHKKNEDIFKYINLNKRCGLFCIVDTNIDSRTIEISYLCYADIKLYERDNLGSIPFSAVICGEEKAINHIKNKKGSHAIECTFRRSEDPIILDVFNRLGVFAIKSIENRISKKQKITLENWLSFVDDERAISTAHKIF
ncbi:hypothetical protein JP28_03845 [Gallibacterium anatis]|uniref:hypothetical protein n=1 Tax=Gallibacterium anatis TaxID=750 RepID=UPI000530E33C|nr:hypothetical protein [Gallibacterium anatis]KGQ44612.1 hypothetical protein JP28_03845 [Gallibacterium anatis]KGQ48086.1 hypothetical protein IO46_12220 [Gallibacterium anatis]KGQ53656.1 hypothetical protein IO44_10905 [Gallibacterium anatis str. Avicor]